MNHVIILAGGVGSRVGAGVPKQFIDIYGKPVLYYTLLAFERNASIDEIGVVCVASHIQKLQSYVGSWGFKKVKWIIEGGENFQESVLCGINYLRKVGVAPKDGVLVHYGASPFVSQEIISDSVRLVHEKGNCVSATPVFLLMGNNVEGKCSNRFVDRDALMALNSPQAFTFEYVDALFKEAQEKNLLDKVEPHTTSLMFALGREIYFSKGDQTNIKITTKEDVELFKGYVLRQKELGVLR